METSDADRRRLEDLQRLYQRMTEIEMPKAMAMEIAQLSSRCLSAALWADIVVDKLATGMSFVLGMCAHAKTFPKAKDG